MFEKTNVTLETLDRVLAITFSQMPALLGERALKPARLAFLRNCMEEGTFASPTWAVVVDKATGTRYRANGQHSSTVLAKFTEDEWQSLFPKGLLVTIEEYTTDDLDLDGYAIFDLFDNPVSARGNVDVMNLHRVHYPDLANIDSNVLYNLMTGVALFENGLEKGLFLSARKRGGYLKRDEYRDFAIWAASFATTIHGWMLKKPGIVAEMVAGRRVDQEIAATFWDLVFNESHSDPDHETRELSRTLKDLTSRPKISQDRFRKEAAKQWRRFRRIQTEPKMNYEVPPPEATGSQPEATL